LADAEDVQEAKGGVYHYGQWPGKQEVEREYVWLHAWGQIKLDLGELHEQRLGRLSNPLHYGGWERKYTINLGIYLEG